MLHTRLAIALVLTTAVLAGSQALAARQHVIPPGGERALLRQLAPDGASLGAGWRLAEATIDKDHVTLTCSKGDVRAVVTLAHPSTARGDARRAGNVVVSGEPAELVDAIVARVGADEMLKWQEVDDGAELGTEPAVAEAPPVDDELSVAVLELLRRVDHLVARGDAAMTAEAVKGTADEIATNGVSRAVLAALAAGTGDGERAARLAAAVPEGEATPLATAILHPKRTAAELLGERTGDDACTVAGIAPHLPRLGRPGLVLPLLEAVLTADPECLGARLALAMHYIASQDGAAALQHIERLPPDEPDDAAVARLRAAALRLTGNLDEAIDEVEQIVRGTARAAGDMGLLLGMYLREKELPKRIDLWRAHAAQHPDDVVAPFMVGVLLHYGNEFEESDRWLKPLNGRLVGEPRLFVYQAMNAFNLGDVATARRLLDEGAELEVVDPDIYYCRAEITRDTERELARSDLQRYLALTEGTPHANVKKQARVRDMLAHLEQCIADGTPKCGGPWEHPRKPYQGLLTTIVWPLLGTVLLGLTLGLWWRRRSR